MNKKQISERMRELATYRWKKTPKKERIAHAKKMRQAQLKAKKAEKPL